MLSYSIRISTDHGLNQGVKTDRSMHQCPLVMGCFIERPDLLEGEVLRPRIDNVVYTLLRHSKFSLPGMSKTVGQQSHLDLLIAVDRSSVTLSAIANVVCNFI